MSGTQSPLRRFLQAGLLIRDGDALFCAQVSVQPLLPALTVDALPESILPHTALSSVLPDADWDALRKAAYRRAGYK